jgi:hypothetical protein
MQNENLNLEFDLLAGINGGTLSDKRVAKDARPVIRTTPTKGNILAMDPAVELMGVGSGARLVINQLPTILAGGKFKASYAGKTRKGLTLAIHSGIADHVVTKEIEKEDGTKETVEVIESFGNKAARAGLGLQFSSNASWTAMEGSTEENVMYLLGETYVALAVYNDGTFKPVTAEQVGGEGIMAYVVIDCEAKDGYAVKQVAEFNAETTTKFWILDFIGTEKKAVRVAGKKESEGDDVMDDDALTLNASVEDLDGEDLGL